MQRKTKTLLTILAFIASFLLAHYLEEHGISLYAQLNNEINGVEPTFIDAPEKIKTTVTTDKKPVTNKADSHHVEVGRMSACKDVSLGEVTYKKIGKVYTWTDEYGESHFSDNPPQQGDFESLSYAGEKVFDYFTLDLNTESLPYNFNQQLTVKLNKLFALYGKLLDVASLKKVDINLRVYASSTEFNQITKAHNIPSGNFARGFYSHTTNKAHLLFTNNEATMRTAAHEAIHAVNRAIIGYSPRWLNEGLAEYSEYLEVKGMSARISPNEDWTKNGKMSQVLLPLSRIISATNKDWRSTLRHRLYATSWAFIHFMMENSQRKQMLAKIIKNEQLNLCDIKTQQSIEKVINLPINKLQQQFTLWSKIKFKTHSI